MKPYLILLFAFISIPVLNAQDAIKNVIVETYYISNENDATDTTGGYLEPGSKTYRVYIEMLRGYKLQKIFGDDKDTLIIKSTKNFFNNKDYGQLFAKNITTYSLRKNTMSLDTWLTLGQVTKTAAKTYFGVLKSQDMSGSIIGGMNNDGGSAGIPGGILTNNDSLAGLPLTAADGMDTMLNVPENWFDWGIADSSIFGSAFPCSEFVSTDAYLLNSGVTGVNPDNNQVLVAQLTTNGEISFQLNVEVSDTDGTITKYVASGKDSDNIKVCTYLKYPPVYNCGCTDPNFKEYNQKYTCSNTDSCKTPIVFGCMDPKACNYNPLVNYNLSALCCYPGKCNDRDISLVCPSLGQPQPSIKVYPNPVSIQLTIEYSSIDNKEIKYSIFNSFGEVVFEKKLGLVSGSFTDIQEISKYNTGVYLIRIYIGDSSYNRMFVKN